jgi:deazaflavin-dependent oxidoreductase (nitroreductase family)
MGNRIGVGLYRLLDGRFLGGSREVNVLIVTVPGRRTGLMHSTCVRFIRTADGVVVWGSGSGSKHDPQWFENLRAAEVASVEIGSDRLRVRPREITGAARDDMWTDVVLAQAPAVARYARKAGRTIPIAILQPVDEAGGNETP